LICLFCYDIHGKTKVHVIYFERRFVARGGFVVGVLSVPPPATNEELLFSFVRDAQTVHVLLASLLTSHESRLYVNVSNVVVLRAQANTSRPLCYTRSALHTYIIYFVLHTSLSAFDSDSVKLPRYAILVKKD